MPVYSHRCDFYAARPSDDALITLARSLLADPGCEGFQVIARGSEGQGLGFATVYWSWSTLAAARTAIMNDLFVHPMARPTRTTGSAHEGWHVRRI